MKKFWIVMAVAALMSATVVNVAEASFAFAINNTGVAGVNNAIDVNWNVTAAPPMVALGGAVIKTTGGPLTSALWLSDAASPPSSWIKPGDGFGVDPIGDYSFTTGFDLGMILPSSASIDGRFLADNQLMDIILNNVSVLPVAGPINEFFNWTNFSITNGFLGGLNTLTFVVRNAVGGGLNPDGLRVEFTATGGTVGPAVPEPAAVASWLIGSLCAVGMIGYRRRRSGDLASAAV